MALRHPAEWLVLRAQSGDRAALEQLLLQTQQRVRPYVAAMLGDDDAADVVQEVLITIYRKLRALQEPRAYDAWSRRIASRAVFASLRRRRSEERAHAPLEDDGGHAAVEPEEVEAGLLAALPSLLQRVSPASREVLTLHYLQELSLEEIAAVLDVPSGTVKSRLAYGLKQLRELARPLRSAV